MPGRVKKWGPKALERAARQLMSGTPPIVVAKSHGVGPDTLVRNVFVHMTEVEPGWTERYAAQYASQRKGRMALIKTGWAAVSQAQRNTRKALQDTQKVEV